MKLCSSVTLLDELAQTLGCPKFAARIACFGTDTATLLARYAALVDLVAPASVPRVVADDADDDHVIAAAVAANASLIVTGDIVTGDRRHLLPIGQHNGIAVITPRQAIERLAGPQPS